MATANNYRKASKFLGWTSWKSRFNTALILDKKHLQFHSEVERTTSSKQTRSFYMKKEIKIIVIFRTLFAYVSLNRIRTHECSRINTLFYIILNSLLRMLPHIFHEPYRPRSTCYAGLSSFCLISKRKQHTFGTFGKINKLQGKQ